jgi:hypothetical protein
VDISLLPCLRPYWLLTVSQLINSTCTFSFYNLGTGSTEKTASSISSVTACLSVAMGAVLVAVEMCLLAIA